MKGEIDLNKWWSSLAVPYKEAAMELPYPACTAAWLKLSLEERNEVFEKMGIERAKRNHTKGFT